jgi:hypothetical protein
MLMFIKELSVTSATLLKTPFCLFRVDTDVVLKMVSDPYILSDFSDYSFL